MVCGGSPNSQRKRPGASNQTRPEVFSGCVNDLRLRVCTNWADQPWILVWAANHELTTGSNSAALALGPHKTTVSNRNDAFLPAFIRAFRIRAPELSPKVATVTSHLVPNTSNENTLNTRVGAKGIFRRVDTGAFPR